ncbi:hypothetical protein, partial [Sphingomonas sp. 66-10]|uniref:hypothetical protein n=1 Tax=Sphingomonas sp. 66-10 TaxID=1895848 RepID=UPI00257A67CF
MIDELDRLIGKSLGRSSFRHDKLDRTGRAGHDLRISRRRYAKLFRLAGRLVDRANRDIAAAISSGHPARSTGGFAPNFCRSGPRYPFSKPASLLFGASGGRRTTI